jgi:NADH-quinone oxidoreductase subunit J
MNTLFYISAAVAVFATVMVIISMNAVHALLYLIVSLLSVALIFFILGAPFAGALEVIIYAGAIMVLFVFVIMMLNLGAQAVRTERNWLTPRVWRGPVLLAFVLLGELGYLLASQRDRVAVGVHVPSKEVAIGLFGPYLLGVELASFLLLAGLIGAYHLGQRDD